MSLYYEFPILLIEQMNMSLCILVLNLHYKNKKERFLSFLQYVYFSLVAGIVIDLSIQL